MLDPVPDSAVPRRLCLLRLSAIGDVTHVLPLVHTLRRSLPETELTWVVGGVEAGLVGDLPGVEVVPFQKAGRIRAWRTLRRRFRGRRFDVLLHMQTALRANIAARAIPAARRIGFDRERSRDGHAWFVNERVAPHPRCHVLEGMLDFARALGIDEPVYDWSVPVPETADAFARAQLPDDRPALAINPCSSTRPRNYRNWLPERYAAVADDAVARHGCRIVLTGGPDPAEQAFAHRAAERMREAPIDLVGRTDLKQLLAVLRRSAALIAPDTGPAHMGTVAGIPVIGLFATSNPRRSGPFRSGDWIVDRYSDNLRDYCGLEPAQAPWLQRVRHPDAMAAITVADVTSRVDAVMNHASGKGGQGKGGQGKGGQ